MGTIPAFTDDQAVAAFISKSLGRVATALGWQIAGSYDLIIENVKLLLGVSDLSTISDDTGMSQLRTVALWQAWEAIVSETAGDFQFSADGGSYNPQQFHEQAKKRAAQYEQQAAAAGVGDYVVSTSKVTYGIDPYVDYEADDIAIQLDQETPA